MADTRTMSELLQAPTEGYGDAIVIPAILAENFELKFGLLTLVTSSQFHGFEMDDPHSHICWFNKITSTLKYKNVPHEAIKLVLFLFSLEGAVRIWHEKEPPHSIHTWEDLVSKLLDPFLEDYIELNDLNELFELRRNQGDDLMPIIEEGVLIEEFRTRDGDLDIFEDMDVLICDEVKYGRCYCWRIAWVALGRERQADVVAGAPEATEGALDVDEGTQAVPIPVQVIRGIEMEKVNELCAERIAKNANPLALVATAQTLQDPYYQTSKPHKSYAPTSKASLLTRSHATTRYKGKEIAKPITPPPESASEEDSDPEQA
ncbi:hypothetical protein Tco_1447380 [Tanacetum coccineum]